MKKTKEGEYVEENSLDVALVNRTMIIGLCKMLGMTDKGVERFIEKSKKITKEAWEKGDEG